LLEDGVGDDQLLLSAKLQQQAPIVVAVSNAVSAKNSFPGIYILTYSGVEIAKDYYLVVCRDALEMAAELRVEPVFFCRFSLESRGVHTEERGILFVLQREAHGHGAVGVAGWQVFQFGGDGGPDHEAGA